MSSMSPEGHYRALVIDDQSHIREFVSAVLRNDGWNVAQSPSAEDAFTRVDEALWSAVFCDVVVGGANGYHVLRHFKEKKPETKVVLMTGHGTAAGTLDTKAYGAYDYLLKPFGPEELKSLSRALREQFAERPQRSTSTRRAMTSHSDIDLVGRSQAFIELMKHVGRVANTDLPLLLSGESGTGKELVASAIHHRSDRRDHPFVVVNCGAIPEDLIEAELFGQVKGSIPGADLDRHGLWQDADRGTLFLDEITKTNSSFQAKLLRALETGEISRVGSPHIEKVNARVITATNYNVAQEVAEGRFAQELFSRLSSVSIVLPPLRERREDIPPLAQSFADRVYSLSPSVKFSNEALTLLEKYNWPGNIRELESVVVRAVAISDGTIRVKELPQRIRDYTGQQIPATSHGETTSAVVPEDWVTLSEIEGRYVARVLEHTGGNKQAAARVLAVDRKTLDRMIKRHHIESHRVPRLRVQGHD